MYILFFLLFPQVLWANTLIETQTAIGIANTLEGTAQNNPQKILNQVKKTVGDYEQVQEQKIKSIQAPSLPAPEQQTNKIQEQKIKSAQTPPSSPIETPPEKAQQRSPQSQQNPALDQATLSEQERDQIQELNHLTDSNNPSPANPIAPSDSLNVQHEDLHHNQELNQAYQEKLPKEEYFQTDRIIEIEKPIDYKTGTQIFYKKDCLPSQSNCKRSGAVFTNIKSVIFNYAHSRGSFSENKNQ